MKRWFTSVSFNIGAQTSPHKERTVTCVFAAPSFGEAREIALAALFEERRRHPMPKRRQITINRFNASELVSERPAA